MSRSTPSGGPGRPPPGPLHHPQDDPPTEPIARPTAPSTGRPGPQDAAQGAPRRPVRPAPTRPAPLRSAPPRRGGPPPTAFRPPPPGAAPGPDGPPTVRLAAAPTVPVGADQPTAVLAPVPAAPEEQTVQVAQAGASLGRASGLMAIAHLVSRVTGFARQIALVTALGIFVLNDSYTVANTLPNIVYELLIGGVLSSVLIPTLVRAQTEDADGGTAFTHKLMTLVGLALVVATGLAVACAPLLAAAYGVGSRDPALLTTLTYLLLPQMLFYGLGALLGAVLGSRHRFGAFAWAPVLNNLVVIATAGVFVLVPASAQVLVLTMGTNLGVAVQALVLLPALRRAGIGFRPRFGWDPRLAGAARQAGWALAYVIVGLPAYLVVANVAQAAVSGSMTIYANAWLLLQVPYGILGVSLLTALMPRMSRAAAQGRFADVVADLTTGARLGAVLLIPVSVLLTVLGTPIGVALFGLRSANLEGATQLGVALAVSAFGLWPYAVTMLQVRVFYALADTRTPVLVQLVTVVAKCGLMLACPLLLDPSDVVLGLAVANSLSFVAGAVLGQLLLRRRLGRLPVGQVLGTAGRVLVAALAGGVLAGGVLLALVALLGDAGLGPLVPGLTGVPVAAAWLTVIVGVLVLGPVTAVGMRLLRVAEFGQVTARLSGLLGRRRPRQQPPG